MSPTTVVKVFALVLFTQASAIAQTDETKKSILATIEGETDAYVKRDSVRLFSFYADDAVTQAAWNNPDGTFGQFKNAKEIKKSFSEFFRNNPVSNYDPKLSRSDWFFRPLGSDWMWVNFIQKLTTPDGKLYTTYETRLMKKDGKVWKIAVMYALSDHGAGVK
jgi:hypothetical protein